jgi:hypothetical protein
MVDATEMVDLAYDWVETAELFDPDRGRCSKELLLKPEADGAATLALGAGRTTVGAAPGTFV